MFRVSEGVSCVDTNKLNAPIKTTVFMIVDDFEIITFYLTPCTQSLLQCHWTRGLKKADKSF